MKFDIINKSHQAGGEFRMEIVVCRCDDRSPWQRLNQRRHFLNGSLRSFRDWDRFDGMLGIIAAFTGTDAIWRIGTGTKSSFGKAEVFRSMTEQYHNEESGDDENGEQDEG